MRTTDELEQLFELPILARIPRSKAFAKASIEEMLQAPEGEAFWTLRNNLRYFKVDRNIRTMLIASAEPNDGKSTVARGLAGAMAAMGDDVILVEADLRKESAFRSGRVPRDGLSTVLTGGPLNSALLEVRVQAGAAGADRKTLTVLPSGPMPPNAAALLESDAMRALLAELENRYELVLIDTPALGSISDVLTLLPMASEIVAVGGIGKTRRDEARDFIKQLSLRSKRPLGLIATFTPLERSRYAYYRRSQPVLRD